MAAAVATAAVVVAGCTAGAGSSGGSTTSAVPVPFGRAAADGKFEFTATQLLRGPTLARLGKVNSVQKPDGEYVVVRLSVRNISDQSKLYSAHAQTLSAGGQEFADDGLAEVALYNNQPSKDVAPGSTIETTVIFDVPVGIVLSTLVVHDSLRSDGAAIALGGAPVEPLSSGRDTTRRVSPTAL
ncbi:hypothetical protein BH09ACT8_BH09ACT8_02090 [soil metagenome]